MLNSVVGDSLVILGDINALSGASRDGYKACIGAHGSGIFLFCYATWFEVWWIVVPETGFVALDLVFEYRSRQDGD